jgi:hypothetical protein
MSSYNQRQPRLAEARQVRASRAVNVGHGHRHHRRSEAAALWSDHRQPGTGLAELHDNSAAFKWGSPMKKILDESSHHTAIR